MAKTKSPSLAKSLLGKTAPSLKMVATNSEEIQFKDFAGKNIILYFYPKDNTPGCTLEGQDFSKLVSEFKKLDSIVFGVSADSLKSHLGFKERCGFKIELISDPDRKLCRAFDVIQMKSMYGRKFEGIERSTFIIDKSGKIAKEWRKVKVTGHAEEVLNSLKDM